MNSPLSVVGRPLSVAEESEASLARTDFEKLEVYLLSERLADATYRMVQNWRALDRDTVGKQLIRAADSVGANIAEGAGRGSFQDNRRFVRNARGSLNEVKHWLRRAFVRQLLSESQVGLLRPMLDELAPRLNAYLKSIGPAEVVGAVSATDNGRRTTD